MFASSVSLLQPCGARTTSSTPSIFRRHFWFTASCLFRRRFWFTRLDLSHTVSGSLLTTCSGTVSGHCPLPPPPRMSTLDNEKYSIPNMASNESPGETSSNPIPATNTTSSQTVEGNQEIDRPPTESEAGQTNQCNERGSPSKRSLTSKAWDHFKRQKIDDKWKTICKYYAKQISRDTKARSKHLHDYIRTCKLRPVRGPRQSKIKTMPQVSSSSGDGFAIESTVTRNFIYNQKISRAELAKMIVLHEYPLSMVEHIGFRKFCNTLQPLWKSITRNTIKADIIKLYDMERIRTSKLLARRGCLL